jgi:hypothetical protein
LEQSSKFAALRLKCDGPRVRNKYIQHDEQYIEKKQLRERIRKLRNWASFSNNHKSMNNWMHYEKKEFTKHNNNAGNSIQGEKAGHQK